MLFKPLRFRLKDIISKKFDKKEKQKQQYL